MQFDTYTDWADLPAGASELFARQEAESLFLTRPWFENLTAHALADGESPLLACVHEAGRVLALLPLIDHGGAYATALSTSISTRYSVLLGENAGPGVLERLALGLRSLPLASYRLEPILPEDDALIALGAALRARGFTEERFFRYYNWVERLNGRGYADYWAERPSRVRNTVSRKQRRLKREHGCDIRLYTDKNIDTALADYQAVEQASWKAREQHARFIAHLVRDAARLGWLRLAVLYVDERPIAAQIWFVVGRKANIFRLSYDQAFESWSPGSILTRFLMEQVIDHDGVKEIDFLNGDERYKADWMSLRRDCMALAFHAPPAASASGPGWRQRMQRLFGRD
ncbi:MAG: GNAT family N-acetyltransferase [Gammaproteobacteria bacterium]